MVSRTREAILRLALGAIIALATLSIGPVMLAGIASASTSAVTSYQVLSPKVPGPGTQSSSADCKIRHGKYTGYTDEVKATWQVRQLMGGATQARVRKVAFAREATRTIGGFVHGVAATHERTLADVITKYKLVSSRHVGKGGVTVTVKMAGPWQKYKFPTGEGYDVIVRITLVFSGGTNCTAIPFLKG